MKSSSMTPVRLRLTLIIALILLATAGVSIFMLGNGKLKEFSASAQTTAAQAATSNSSLNNLQATKVQLEQQSDVIERASLIVAESRSYLYQDQIITDITKLAKNADISITNISFGAVTSATPGAAATATPAADPTSGGATPSPGASSDNTSTTAPSNVKSMTATITLANPIHYSNMLTFIHSIEQSLTKMRISTIGLSKASDGSKGGMVTSDTLTLEVYVR